MTLRVEHVNEAMAGSGHVIVLLRILFRISHKQVAIDVRNVKWRIASRYLWIGEIAVESNLREHSVRSVRPEHIHRAVTEVGRKQERALGIHREGQTFVDGATR